MDSDPSLSQTQEELDVVISGGDYNQYLLRKGWHEAFNRLVDTQDYDKEGLDEAVHRVSLGTIKDIDDFTNSNPDLRPEAAHFLQMSRLAKVSKEKSNSGADDSRQETTVTLTGSKAKEYQDFQLYMEMLGAVARDPSRKRKIIGRGLGSLAMANGKELSSYLNEHWPELTTEEVKEIEARMRLVVKGVTPAKYAWF